MNKASRLQLQNTTFRGLMLLLILGVGFVAGRAAIRYLPLASSSSSSSSLRTSCYITLVTLHFDSGPTVKCSALPITNGKVSFDKLAMSSIGNDNPCQSYSWRLYVDINSGGPVICFSGNGFIADLNDYSYPCGIFTCSWDNAASSYKSGGGGGTFYATENGSGTTMSVFSYKTENLPGTAIGNDNLSSLCLEVNNNCPS